MTYKEAEEYLYEKLPRFTHIGKAAYMPGLERIKTLCAQLDHPENKIKTIHIAGTNGKGSSSHYLASIFMEAGYKTGLYTSPHLRRFTERIKINGIDIPESFFIDFVQKSKLWIENNPCSFFELTTAMAFDYFAQEKVDIAIIETGIGGRLDATNIIKPECSLITNIGTDHKEILGDTPQKIAYEKAGIIKENTPVVVSEYQENVWDTIYQIALNNNSYITSSEDINILLKENNLRQIEIQTFNWKRNCSNPLLGSYQLKNLKGVIKTCEILHQKGWCLTPETICLGIAHVLKNTHLKGRWQQLKKVPLVYCDTGHNIEGIQEVTQMISFIPALRKIIILGMAQDKDAESILRLFPREAEYIFTRFASNRSRDPYELGSVANEIGLRYRILPSVHDSIVWALTHTQKEDFIFIGGSTFVVAEIDEALFSD